MKNERQIAFIISRISNVFTFIGGYYIKLGKLRYGIFGPIIMIITIFYAIWGILGFIGLFDEKITGNIVALLVCLGIGVQGAICLFSSIVWGPVYPVIFGSIITILSDLISFYADIVVFSGT
ncbi:MAG: hypothetical protein ACTSRP_21960 [Candidatus Helarchaeota archaeon]